MKFLRFIVPRMPLRAIPKLLLLTGVGAIVGGTYGVIHDQVTYSISAEYFTRFKFIQFSYAGSSEEHPRIFAGKIGFLATWWVGALVSWVLCRVSLRKCGDFASTKVMAKSFAIVFAVSIVSAFCGWIWGMWRKTTGYAEGWLQMMNEKGVVDHEAFMTVGYIHNASYAGGSIGMIFGILYLNAQRKRHESKSYLAEQSV